mgnify:CR=1 FL=1
MVSPKEPMVASLSLTLVFLAGPNPGVDVCSKEDIVTQERAPELTFSPDGSTNWVCSSVPLRRRWRSWWPGKAGLSC